MQVSFGKLNANQSLTNYIEEKREEDLRQVLNRLKRNKKILNEVEVMIVTAKCLELSITPRIYGRAENYAHKSFTHYIVDFNSPQRDLRNKTTASRRLVTIKFTYVENKLVEFSVDYFNGRSFSTKNKNEIPSMLAEARNNLVII